MSQTTAPPAPEPVTAVTERPQATLTHALHGEWTKIRSLRSTVFTLLAMFAVAVIFGMLGAANSMDEYQEAPEAFDPVMYSYFYALLLSQLAVAVLGVLTITGEHTTGMIRTSLTAVPSRGRLLAAKLVVFAAVALAAGLVTALSTFLASQAVLADTGLPYATLGDPGVLRAIVGFALYLTVIGLIAVAVGVLVRATAGGILIMVVGITILPNLLPDGLAELWPLRAGLQIITVLPDPGAAPAFGLVPGALPVWVGFGYMCAFAAALLAVAYLVFRRRDV